MEHMTSFVEFIKNNNKGCYFHEDIMRKLLALTLEGYAQDWLVGLGRRKISSFIWFLEIFCTKCSHGEQWHPMVELIKTEYHVLTGLWNKN